MLGFLPNVMFETVHLVYGNTITDRISAISVTESCLLPPNPKRDHMCEDCDKLEETIARYLRLQQQIDDPQVQEAATRLMAELREKKAALHPE